METPRRVTDTGLAEERCDALVASSSVGEASDSKDQKRRRSGLKGFEWAIQEAKTTSRRGFQLG